LKGSKSMEAKILGLRYWSNPSYTRIVVDADNEMSYTHKLLKKDTSIKKPQRLYIDLNNSKLGKDITKVVPINDDLLIDARAGQYASNSVRVVVDIKSFETYKIFSLRNPFRIVIDIWGTAAKPELPPIKTDQKYKKIPPGALAKQLALGVRRIVIDPGHGGRDYGAPGYLRGVHEKDVVLKLARQLAKKIRKELGCEVIMTRNSDRYLTLEERTAIANTKNADLFISIHTNAVRDRRAYGIETFFLNLATDNDAILVAARENATSTKNISDLETILSDLMQNAKINESSRLAVQVQKSMNGYLRKHYSRIKSKGVKQAPFYVLMGAQMPAILIETSFISNPRECKRLNDPVYQDQMSEAIVQGIKEYIKDTNPTALMEDNPNPVSKRYGG
jgi:N-acetylmuramoyl-L-alanine amidase